MPDTSNSFVSTYWATFDALTDAIEALKDLSRDDSQPQSEQDKAGAAAIDLGTELLIWKARADSFLKAFSTPDPPSAAVVAQAIQHSQDVAKLVADAQTAEANLDAVVGVVTAFDQLVSGGATAAQGAATAGVMSATSLTSTSGRLAATHFVQRFRPR